LLAEYGFCAGLGLCAAVVGVAFIRVLYGLEDLADRVWRGREWLRPAVGGLGLGLVLLVLPEMYGVGYPVLVFMGAMLGTAYGNLMQAGWPDLTGPAGAYGLVGMGAVFAAAARAPMTAVISILELTGQYQLILPLMLAVALAAGISNLLSRDTIFSRGRVSPPASSSCRPGRRPRPRSRPTPCP
jgi:CIC family chloride channel protein